MIIGDCDIIGGMGEEEYECGVGEGAVDAIEGAGDGACECIGVGDGACEGACEGAGENDPCVDENE